MKWAKIAKELRKRGVDADKVPKLRRTLMERESESVSDVDLWLDAERDYFIGEEDFPADEWPHDGRYLLPAEAKRRRVLAVMADLELPSWACEGDDYDAPEDLAKRRYLVTFTEDWSHYLPWGADTLEAIALRVLIGRNDDDPDHPDTIVDLETGVLLNTCFETTTAVRWNDIEVVETIVDGARHISVNGGKPRPLGEGDIYEISESEVRA